MSEARLDVISVDDDVVIGIRYAQIIGADEDVVTDGSKFAMELGAIWRQGHLVDWDGIPVILSRRIEDLTVLLPWFYEYVLRCDEAVWNETPDPMRYVKDVIITFFFVHGGHDLVESTSHGHVVAFSPVE